MVPIFQGTTDSKQPWIPWSGPYGPLYKTPQPKPSMAPELRDQPKPRQPKRDHWTWWSMGWIYKETWPDEDSHTANQNVATSSWEKDFSEADFDMEIGLVSNVEDKMWEQELPRVGVEEHQPQPQYSHEQLIQTTQEVLKRQLSILSEARRSQGEAKSRRGEKCLGKSSRKSRKHAKANIRIDVRDLRYSQLTCRQRFHFGGLLEHLVQDLLRGRVTLSAPFLRLTVFETIDSNNDPIIKCIDNRRLWALKEFARRSGQQVMVNVDLVSQWDRKLGKRIIHNCDVTDGHDVTLRPDKQRKTSRI